MKHLLFFSLVCFWILSAKAQKNISSLDIEINNDYSTFSMLDSVVNDHTVFFTGENHNFRTSNYKLQLKMLKYLYQKNGTRHLFLEFGVSRGWLVNNYIQTGDSALFKILKNYSYDEYALLYKELREFNKDLPDDKKIMVHGIDIERSFSTPIKVLSMLLPKTTNIPSSISLNIETLKALAGKVDDEHNAFNENDENESTFSSDYSSTRYNTQNTLKRILNDYDSLKNEYQTYLGDQAPVFDEIIEGLKAEFKRNEYLEEKSMQSFIYREQFMYNEMLKLVKQYPGDKFYGQFGRCHTPFSTQDNWCDFYFFNSLATRLNTSDDDVLKNKVFSIGIYYPNTTTFENAATEKDKLDKLFAKQTKEGIKLVKIDKADSLFSGVYDKYQYLIINYEGYKKENTTKEEEWKYNDPKNKEFSYGFTFPNLEAHAGFYFLNFKNLQSTFETFGLPAANTPQLFLGGAATLYEDWFLYGSVSFHFLPKVTNRYSDTAEITFGGYFVKGYFGYETTASEIFNITPRLGIGYGRLNFEQKFDQPIEINPGTGIFPSSGSTIQNTYNDAVLIDPGVDIRFNIRYVAIGLNTGYQIDFTEKKWFSDSQGIISDSPKTGLNGFYAMLTLSFFYSIW